MKDNVELCGHPAVLEANCTIVIGNVTMEIPLCMSFKHGEPMLKLELDGALRYAREYNGHCPSRPAVRPGLPPASVQK